MPGSHPGFLMQHDEIVPYTFEPMPLHYYEDHRQAPSQLPAPYSSLSMKSQPAVAVMAPAEYHHVGVSEAELAEMWALLEDENGTPGNRPAAIDSLPMPSRIAIPNEINEHDMENYSKLSSRSLRFFTKSEN